MPPYISRTMFRIDWGKYKGKVYFNIPGIVYVMQSGSGEFGIHVYVLQMGFVNGLEVCVSEN